MLKVWNLSRTVSDAHLREIFGHCGYVQRVKLSSDSGPHGAKAHAEVEFENHRLAFDAVEVFDGAEASKLGAGTEKWIHRLLSSRGLAPGNFS